MKKTFTFALLVIVNIAFGQTYEELKNKNLPKPKNPNITSSVNFTESNLPIVVINTNGQTIPDEPGIIAHMGIIYNGVGAINHISDPFNHYNNNVDIELRGNSSQFYPKKPFGFETLDANNAEKSYSILGMPSNTDWTLIPTVFDKTMMRNSVSYLLWSRMGYYAPRTRFCEVVLNGVYQGVYTLTEKIKRGDKRVNIKKLVATDDASKISGGYIVKTDHLDAGDTNYWVSTLTNQNTQKRYIVQTPKPSELNIDQFNYIKQYFLDFENNLASPSFDNPTTGYRSFIDENTFMDYFIFQEFSKNIDGYMSSIYFHKDRNEKLKMGPIWDFDWAYHYDVSSLPCNDLDLTSGWMFRGSHCIASLSHFWWERFLQDCKYTSTLRSRYANLRQTIMSDSSLNSMIDSLANHLTIPMTREYQKWGLTIFGTNQINFQTQVNGFKNWIFQRLAWMDIHIKDLDTFSPVISTPNLNIPHGMTTNLISSTIPSGFTLEWKWTNGILEGFVNSGTQNTLSITPLTPITYQARLIKNDGSCSTYYSNQLSFNTNPICQDEITLTQSITYSSSPIAEFKANSKIYLQNTINSNTKTTFKSGGRVEFLPGFNLNNGAVFEAKIENCSN